MRRNVGGFIGDVRMKIALGRAVDHYRSWLDLADKVLFAACRERGNDDIRYLEKVQFVFGARLRITTLRAGEGPGIELLEYLTPRDGRLMPTDERANDLIHWQTNLVTANLDRAAESVRERRLSLVSSGVVSLSDERLGFSRAFLARDPDGHVMAFSTHSQMNRGGGLVENK